MWLNAVFLRFFCSPIVGDSGATVFIEDTDELFHSLQELVSFYSETACPAKCTLLAPTVKLAIRFCLDNGGQDWRLIHL